MAAAFYEGLPELKIEEIIMKNISVSYAQDAREDVPAMSVGVEPCCKKGICAHNVGKLVLNNVEVKGQIGENVELHNVDVIE